MENPDFPPRWSHGFARLRSGCDTVNFTVIDGFSAVCGLIAGGGGDGRLRSPPQAPDQLGGHPDDGLHLGGGVVSAEGEADGAECGFRGQSERKECG